MINDEPDDFMAFVKDIITFLKKSTETAVLLKVRQI